MVAFFFDLEEIGAVGAAGAGFFVGPLDLEYGVGCGAGFVKGVAGK